ncbi:hypothetical protein [Shewanella frigidimarina]|uniref:Uncharacterized protein n=1 Tax=Shewanella frigidimarina (strain NCIMB 400) TaxID=318167 RepID=Q07X62_SHEFN|nr:hypothetical protein [Shewanella frigidimarina]ABI73402.1 hypothetical protein Sfri_3575 [Shewanella frigidimarina NCIMB 400]
MIKIDSSIDTYNENLGKAYDSRLSKEDKIILKDYFSDLVSNSFAKSHPVPEKALEALKHIDKSLHEAKIIDYKRESQTNWQNSKPQYLIIGGLIFIVGAIAWHYLSPNLPSFVGF